MPIAARFALLLIVTTAVLAAQTPAPAPAATTDPIAIARILAAKYPAQPIMSYIPALSWSGQMRLSELTGEPQWREKALKDMEAFTSGRTPAKAEPYRLTSMAGAQAFFDAWTITHDAAAQKIAMEIAAFTVDSATGDIKFATGWTDDMFMASSVLSRGGVAAHADVVYKLLTTYAKRLQRPDGLFMHATDGPFAWGRGNGFALLGVTDALTYWPASWKGRADILDIYKKHVAAMAKFQSDDGSWRQVVDEPTAYRELTVTAMTTAAIARGIRLGWIDRATYEPVVKRGWNAVAARVNADGTVRDVCSGTGSGPLKEYYMNRPVVNGADDRGGAMALLASIEVEMLRRR
jgi:rhamnogalacturonyl hydrolase YesR